MSAIKNTAAEILAAAKYERKKQAARIEQYEEKVSELYAQEKYDEADSILEDCRYLAARADNELKGALKAVSTFCDSWEIRGIDHNANMIAEYMEDEAKKDADATTATLLTRGARAYWTAYNQRGTED